MQEDATYENQSNKNKKNYPLVLPYKIRMSKTHKQCSKPGSHRFWPFNVSRLETFLTNKEVSTSRPTQARPILPKRGNINQSQHNQHQATSITRTFMVNEEHNHIQASQCNLQNINSIITSPSSRSAFPKPGYHTHSSLNQAKWGTR